MVAMQGEGKPRQNVRLGSQKGQQAVRQEGKRADRNIDKLAMYVGS